MKGTKFTKEGALDYLTEAVNSVMTGNQTKEKANKHIGRIVLEMKRIGMKNEKTGDKTQPTFKIKSGIVTLIKNIEEYTPDGEKNEQDSDDDDDENEDDSSDDQIEEDDSASSNDAENSSNSENDT